MRALRQHGVATGIIQAHVDARRAVHTVAGHVIVRQGADQGLLQPVHIFLYVVAGALQIQQRIGHHLSRAMVRDLPAAVGGHDRDVTWGKNMIVFSGKALRINRGMLTNP